MIEKSDAEELARAEAERLAADLAAVRKFRDEIAQHLESAAGGQPRTISDLALRDKDFSGLVASDAIFVRCDFSGTKFIKAELVNTTFSGCLLQGTDFAGANLLNAKFKAEETGQAPVAKPSLYGANFTDADLQNAVFSNVSLTKVKAIRTQFGRANFNGIPLTDATLDSADLRSGENLVLDHSSTHLAEFSPDAKDDWSVLRRTYTGTRFILILIFCGIFAATLAAKTFAFYGLSLASKINVLGYSLEQYCAVKKCIEKPLYYFLTGWNDGEIAVALVALTVIYNVVRFALTVFISGMREEEERSHRSPALSQYGGMIYLHYGLQFTQGIVIVLFLLHMSSVLGTEIIIPVLKPQT